MTDAEKLAMLAELFDIEADDLRPEMNLDELEEWDSVNKLSLIIMMDDAFDRAIDGDLIKTLKSVRDILDIMSAD